ncbi:hypothetical protein Pyrfu_1531 [Pyrolobus fumarii 1A]|uniref:Uncharacterized protein n=1 Tax=Pyrolobus fumarii (strain DSM 11204 / 1A) TaxID=694429 RepID=G0EHN5_PYRF1|nr:hypothetical protein [Pyrolobus fumarii]AEM39388.1 hypothetical protein Pyrfu_1531 [Pyrolobus fumarii 1A]
MELVVEKSKSRRGLHAIVRKVFVVSRNGNVVEVTGPRVGAAEKTYSRGEAYLVKVQPGKDDVVVYVVLVKGLRGRVKGYFEVYDSTGRLVYRAVYRKLKLRYSKGDPNYAWAVKLVVEKLDIPVKKYNLVPAWLRRGR